MKSSVITFPGSNCDRDMHVALNKFGFKNKMVWHDDLELPKSDLVVLPGGFSYGDYLRCGSMAAKFVLFVILYINLNMKFTKSLIKGKLIKRYKRFFVDVKLINETVTAHDYRKKIRN